ncbi:F1F0-ATP synthase G subunit [Ceratobasidium sp. AG-Ba]|nr:F1F0-ATP synthase G subunit [Ceratobasidium sp. AG-Ba]
MRTHLFRTALRTQKNGIRHVTTQSAQESAQQALNAAQKQAEKALEMSKQIGGKVGERVGGWMGAYREPVTYNLAVARAFLRQVYIAEKLAPPTSAEAFTTAYRTLYEHARNPEYWKGIARSGEWARVALYGIEAYGIFHIGQMIGRRHIVGYKLN